MPYGQVSLVMRLSPLQPGYVMTECADASVAAAIVKNSDESILCVCVCVRYRLKGRNVVGKVE
jgi:hypothetical protein